MCHDLIRINSTNIFILNYELEQYAHAVMVIQYLKIFYEADISCFQYRIEVSNLIARQFSK